MTKIAVILLSLLPLSLPAFAQQPVEAIADSVAQSQIARLTHINDSLQRVVDQARPIVIASLKTDNAWADGPFDSATAAKATTFANLAATFAPTDKELTPRRKQAIAIADIAKVYTDAVYYVDNRLYSPSANDSIAATLKSYANRQELNASRRQQLADLAERIANYYYAVLRFDSIISDVDQLRDNYRGTTGTERLLADEISEAFSHDNKHLVYINRYPALAGLFAKYSAALRSDPFNGGADIVATIASLLNSNPTNTDNQ